MPLDPTNIHGTQDSTAVIGVTADIFRCNLDGMLLRRLGTSGVSTGSSGSLFFSPSRPGRARSPESPQGSDPPFPDAASPYRPLLGWGHHTGNDVAYH